MIEKTSVYVAQAIAWISVGEIYLTGICDEKKMDVLLICYKR